MNNLKASCSFDEFGFVIATFCTPGQQHDSWVCYYLFFYFKKPHNFLFGTSFRPFYRLWNMSDQPAIPLIPSIFSHLQFLKLIYIQFQSSSGSRYWNACSWRCEYIFQLLPRRIFLTICAFLCLAALRDSYVIKFGNLNVMYYCRQKGLSH